MSVALQRFANGSTDYVSRHNANASAIEVAIASLESLLSASQGAAVSIGSALFALFGGQTAIVGSPSYAVTPSGTNLTVAAGYAWIASSSILVSTAGPSTLAFAGQGANTYYVKIDTAGLVSRSTSPTDALHSVVWTGSAFGAITRVAPIVWGAQDWIDAQTSTALGETFDSLDERLEAIEAVAGPGARNAQTQLNTFDISAGGTAVLDADDVNAAVLKFEGALAANAIVEVPVTGERSWVVLNSTTGAYTVTLKKNGATGVVLPSGLSLVYQDGTDVHFLREQGARVYTPSLYSPGVLANDQIILFVPVAEALAIPADMVGSYAVANAAATGPAVLTVHKVVSGTATQIGTISFGAGGTPPVSATLATTSGAAQTVPAGAVLRIRGPATADATLADIGIAIAATR